MFDNKEMKENVSLKVKKLHNVLLLLISLFSY